MKRKESLRGPGNLLLVLDASEIYPDDPGAGTPALVILPFGRGTATYWCAAAEGEVDGHLLTERQNRWLESVENAVDQWLDIRTTAIKRDGRAAVLAALE